MRNGIDFLRYRELQVFAPEPNTASQTNPSTHLCQPLSGGCPSLLMTALSPCLVWGLCVHVHSSATQGSAPSPPSDVLALPTQPLLYPHRAITNQYQAMLHMQPCDGEKKKKLKNNNKKNQCFNRPWPGLLENRAVLEHGGAAEENYHL